MSERCFFLLFLLLCSALGLSQHLVYIASFFVPQGNLPCYSLARTSNCRQKWASRGQSCSKDLRHRLCAVTIAAPEEGLILCRLLAPLSKTAGPFSFHGKRRRRKSPCAIWKWVFLGLEWLGNDIVWLQTAKNLHFGAVLFLKWI